MATEASAATVLNARMQRVHARGRTAEALLGIALDVFEPFALDYLSPDDYKRLCDLVAAPVSVAAHAAVETLVHELAAVRPLEAGDLQQRLSRPRAALVASE